MRLAALLFALALVVAPSFANGPTMMNYQAVFTDADGNIMPDGDYVIGFHIYTGPFGGPPIWSEWDSVTVENGVFEVLLGWGHPLQITDFPAAGAWLGLSYDDVYLTPRQFIAAVPYSFWSCYADSASKADSVGNHDAANLDQMESDIDTLQAMVIDLQNQINNIGTSSLPVIREHNATGLISFTLGGDTLLWSSAPETFTLTNASPVLFMVEFGPLAFDGNNFDYCCGFASIQLRLVNTGTGLTVNLTNWVGCANPGSPRSVDIVQAGSVPPGNYRVDVLYTNSIDDEEVTTIVYQGISFKAWYFPNPTFR